VGFGLPAQLGQPGSEFFHFLRFRQDADCRLTAAQLAVDAGQVVLGQTQSLVKNEPSMPPMIAPPMTVTPPDRTPASAPTTASVFVPRLPSLWVLILPCSFLTRMEMAPI